MARASDWGFNDAAPVLLVASERLRVAPVFPMTNLSAPLTEYAGLAVGAIVDQKYRIDGVLGAGGMGVVLSATHLELDAPVALKVVRDELARNEEAVSRLIFEARAAARMRSVHIVRVLDVARLPTGAPYIVMEHLQGSDLQVVLSERGALSVAEAVGYVLQACEGLVEAHALGIIHRDLKPENLFLATTPEGVVLKILDFGISKDVGSARGPGNRSTLTKDGSAVGSPYYMSPEQMRAAPNLDARSDIWSLGAILFELLTNRCPFEAETPARLCTKVMTEEPPSLLGFSITAPAQLDAVIRRCLQKEADARFQSVADLADALRAFVAAEAASVDPRRVASGIDLKAEPAEIAHTSLHSIEDEQNPFVKKRTGLALFGVSALLVVAGVAFWQLQIRPDGAKWLAAGAAELPARSVSPGVPVPAPRSAAPLDARPGALLDPVERNATPAASSSAKSVPAAHTAPAPISAAARPAAAPVAPRPAPVFRARPALSSASTRDPNDTGERYGL